jgi:hypothetical protein
MERKINLSKSEKKSKCGVNLVFTPKSKKSVVKQIDEKDSNVYFTPLSDEILTKEEIEKEATKSELRKIREIFDKKDYLKNERSILADWHNRNCVNNQFYRLNFLLNERKKNTSFITSNDEDNEMLYDYDRRECLSSRFNDLWTAQYYEARFLKTIREDEKLNLY